MSEILFSLPPYKQYWTLTVWRWLIGQMPR